MEKMPIFLASVDFSHPMIVKTEAERITKRKYDFSLLEVSNTQTNHFLEKNYSLYAVLMLLNIHYSMSSLLLSQVMCYLGND